MSKYPSEIFGYPHYVANSEAEEARKRYWCPFANKPCYKQSRLISHAFGVCSAHIAGKEIAICPRRFLDNYQVFTDIALDHFQTVNNILLFSEVRLQGIGSFDFVMLKHKPMSSEIEDFAVIEFQTGQTTGTGKLVQGFIDFLKGESIAYRSYNFGLNAYDIWKRTFTQVLNKGIILETWGHKIYWVVQEPVYQDFEKRYNLQNIGFDPQNATVFSIYNLLPQPTKFELVTSRKTSASIDQLFAAFRQNPNIPSKKDFLNALQNRILEQSHISLKLASSTPNPDLDIKPPSSSGRIRDEADNDDLG
jgi:hypothetical protein